MELIKLKLALIVLFTFLVTIFIIPIHIKIAFKRKNWDDKVNIRITLLKGLIKFNYEIPYLDLIVNNKGPFLKIKEKLVEKNTEKNLLKKKGIISLENIIQVYNKIKRYKYIFIEILEYILRKTDFRSLVWSSKIGLGDAALTGIVYGSIWMAMSTLLGIIMNHKNIKELRVEICPEFNENILEIDFFCIIKLKIVHIIIAGLKGMKVFVKGGVLNA